MGIKYLTYIFISIVTIGLLMTSCDSDDSTSIKNIEGHWLYIENKIDISVSDPDLKKGVEKYIADTLENTQISYEFKNDRTYYCHRDDADPVKGKFKMLDKNYYQIDDIRGEKKIVREDSKIYILTDFKKEIARQMNIPEDKIIEATVTEVFERGLSSN